MSGTEIDFVSFGDCYPTQQLLTTRGTSPQIIPPLSTQRHEKRKISEVDIEEVSGGSSENRQNPVPVTHPQEGSSLQRSFACPFYKGPVDRSKLKPSCFGPRWTEVHRVKHHIKRCHTPRIFTNPSVCGRCHESFKSQELLVKHQREQLQCPIKEPVIVTGMITLEQAAKLKAARKKSNVSSEKTWFEWYRIIFPDDFVNMPLTPYHEPSTAPSVDIFNTQDSTSIASYRDTLVGASDMRKKQKLEASLEDWGVSDPNLRKRLAVKVQEYQFQQLQEYIETSRGTPMNQNVAEVEMPQLQMEDPHTFSYLGQDTQLECFGLQWMNGN